MFASLPKHINISPILFKVLTLTPQETRACLILTHVYEMYVAGFQFQVLSPVFTCHWGLQSRKGRPSWREKQNNSNRRKFDVFKREIFARYHKDPLHMIQQVDNQPKKIPLRVVNSVQNK